MEATLNAQETEKTLDPRYPIGPFHWGGTYSEDEIKEMIDRIEKFPSRLKMLVIGMTDEQLDRPYREGGWTARQVIHHIPDSHMNAYVRFKLALSEDKPTIKPYNEKAWAEMIDSRTLPPSVSLSLLSNIHERWSIILTAMKPEDFQRTLFHPEHMQMHTLSEMLAMYSWHGDHHYEHISLVKKMFPAARKAKEVSAQAKSSKPAKKSAKAGKKTKR